MQKETLIAELLAELYEQGKFRIEGGRIYVETESSGGTQENNETDNGEHGKYSGNGGSKRAVVATQSNGGSRG
ncbi:hypothetical protein [Thermosipho sp. 1074]|uniref:hypothetical protein n=1 Tax=Thermosipho sp. 1074 TaxID=1643331 RepID=UPI0009857E5B|nr:hypothetical protein [Thermosipho sp. 1074]OOC42167.1 hypothetical protein XO08_07735 [Thermosipho sp. 1074]